MRFWPPCALINNAAGSHQRSHPRQPAKALAFFCGSKYFPHFKRKAQAFLKPQRRPGCEVTVFFVLVTAYVSRSRLGSYGNSVRARGSTGPRVLMLRRHHHTPIPW